MRACFQSTLSPMEQYVLRGEILHHLVHVVRLKVGENLLLLNGTGLEIITEVEAISKKELILTHRQEKQHERSYCLDLALGMPKKESLELSLKEATEIGFRNIFLVRSDYSQMRPMEEERLQKLLISALEQSNAPFLPQVSNATWEELPWNSYGDIFLMDSQTKDNRSGIAAKKPEASRLLVVGPEGGFSPNELSWLHAKSDLSILCLPTPILRTSTAVAVGAGILLQTLLD